MQDLGVDRAAGNPPGGPAEERLSALDAAFLYLERPNEPLNVGLSGVYEGSLSRRDVVRAVLNCLPRLPRLSERPVPAPLGLAQPEWRVDPDFDPERHVTEQAVGEPGDARAFAVAAGSVMAVRLDRTRPLWRLVLLRGLADGNSGLVLVIHHAMADLLSCFDVALELHGQPLGRDPRAGRRGQRSDGIPNGRGPFARAAVDRAIELAGLWREGVSELARPDDLATRARRMARVASGGLREWLEPPPSTPFNGPLSARRDSAWLELPLPEIEAVRGVTGGTVNDLVLALIGGGLRGWFKDGGLEVNDLQIRLLCPASLRMGRQRGALGNRISWVTVSLDLGIADSLARLRACRREMDQGKQEQHALARKEWMEVLRWAPPVWQETAGRLADPSGNFNSIVTNVKGPPMALSLAGHRALVLLPWAPLAAGMGLVHAIGSYAGRIFVNVIVDPERIADPEAYVRHLDRSWQELRSAAAP